MVFKMDLYTYLSISKNKWHIIIEPSLSSQYVVDVTAMESYVLIPIKLEKHAFVIVSEQHFLLKNGSSAQ